MQYSSPLLCERLKSARRCPSSAKRERAGRSVKKWAPLVIQSRSGYDVHVTKSHFFFFFFAYQPTGNSLPSVAQEESRRADN